ncbi:MAG: alpha/beta hydrolase, partial [Verrucomicrobiales bacterium]|nr:alpha/beta hydrolase [Verrucomicrobiales bacterium]
MVTPPGKGPWPVLVICHGAGEFKENYQEMASALAARGIASFIPDMHGHGLNCEVPFRLSMKEWVGDVRAAVRWIEA